MKKIDYKKYFKDKKITLMGLGGFSRSLIEAKFLAETGADLIITDLTLEKDLKNELEELKDFKNISYTLGKHDEEDFKNRDIVFSANGVPLGNRYIEIAKNSSKLLTKTAPYVFYILQKESLENNLKIKTIGITGTKGKSTTTSLIVNLLEKYLEEKNNEKDLKNDFKNKVFVGGNVRGTANLTILPKIKSGDFFVAELDSWLLQGFESLKFSPEISIFTNFFNDHQNYYHSMEKYFKDKKFIADFQKKDDLLILTKNSKKAFALYSEKDFKMNKLKSKKIVAKKNNNPKWNYSIFGKHNEENISQVLEVAKFLNISEEVQKKAMENYVAEEGRFQKLENKNNIIFYNDNNATTPESTIISLEALKEKNKNSKIFLISGGADKDFEDKNYKKLAESIEKNSYFSVFFEGSGTEKLFKYFSEDFIENKKYKKINSMEEAFLNLKKENILEKDIIFLSPAMASFGVFKNEYERNDLFLEEYEKF